MYIVSLYRLPTKRTVKTSRRKCEGEFFETHKTTRALDYSALGLLTAENLRRSTSRTLLVTLGLSGLSLGAFTG